MQKQNLIFISIIAILAALVAILAWQNHEQKKIQLRMLSEFRKSSGKNGKQPVDQYIANEVKNTIIKHAREIQECFNTFIAKTPKKTDGILKVDWRINTGGRPVKPAVVYNELGDPDFGACVTGRIAAWEFPRPLIEKYVAHTFKFSMQ